MSKLLSMLRNERGDGMITIIVILAIVGAMIFVGIQLIPIFWDHANLRDDILTVLRFAFVNYPQNTKERVTEDVKKLLTKSKAEYKDKDLKIEMKQEEKYLKVQIWYSRTHKVPFFQNPKQFYLEVDNREV